MANIWRCSKKEYISKQFRTQEICNFDYPQIPSEAQKKNQKNKLTEEKKKVKEMLRRSDVTIYIAEILMNYFNLHSIKRNGLIDSTVHGWNVTWKRGIKI